MNKQTKELVEWTTSIIQHDLAALLQSANEEAENLVTLRAKGNPKEQELAEARLVASAAALGAAKKFIDIFQTAMPEPLQAIARDAESEMETLCARATPVTSFKQTLGTNSTSN